MIGRSRGAPGPPDFVGVGALGSGAGWWHAMLLAHPEVAPPRARRPGRALHFFDRFCSAEMLLLPRISTADSVIFCTRARGLSSASAPLAMHVISPTTATAQRRVLMASAGSRGAG